MSQDILQELGAAAARKWTGDSSAQRAGLFARAAAEIKAARDDANMQRALRQRHIVLQVGQMQSRCAELVRQAYTRHGLCCADCERIAALIEGLE